jgi:hypothetical protein
MDNTAKMQQIMETLAKAEADRKADIEDMLARIKEDRQANQELLARMDAMFDAHQKRMSCFGQTEARLEYEEPASGNIKDDRNETTACNVATEKIEPDPSMMQSAEEHQDILSEDVGVMPVKGPKKWRRGQKSIAGRCGEPKDLT